MQKCIGVVCAFLISCAALSETVGLVIAAKEKRGWTLNSAGYLLGPRRIEHLIQIKDSPSARGREDLLNEYAIDSHRMLGNKHGLAGKRDLPIEDETKSMPPKSLKITAIQFRFLALSLAHRDFSGFSESFNDIMYSGLRTADETVIHTIVDFLSYLKLKEMGALDNVSPSLTSEELGQP